MLDRSARLAILTALLTWQAASAQANDVYFAGRVAGGGPAEMTRTVRGTRPVAAVTGGYVQQAGLVGPPSAASWERPVRLPPVLPRSPAPGELADGTWREDGRYIIINLNGQQVRLVKEAQSPDAQGVPHRVEGTGGTVYGRLLNRGRPMKICQVIIRPVRKTFSGYTFRQAAEPIRTTTDGQGVYRFENVPPGLYKLSWLPQATNQWIRKIAMRPDLTVRTQETTQVKDIPVALRTIN